jgi:hypothetical protein
LGFYSLFSAPAWGLLTTISLTHLPDGEIQFPLVRLGATLGWIVAGAMTSFLFHADVSAKIGYASAATRLLSGILAFRLPHTPPLGKGSGWRSRLGFNAFKLLKHRDHCVFFVVTTLFSIPLTAFYMYAPELLKVLGNAHVTATMSIAQVSEVIAMLLVGRMMKKFSVKELLLWALGLSVIRFAMSAYAGMSGFLAWHIGGIALHGMCYTFYFITAQVFLDRRVEPGLKGQAQGFLSIVSIGVGPLIGAVLCGLLHRHYVTNDGRGWTEFWGILSAMIGVCFLVFLIFYKGLGRPHSISQVAE